MWAIYHKRTMKISRVMRREIPIVRIKDSVVRGLPGRSHLSHYRMWRHTNLCMKSKADTGGQKSLGSFCAARSTRSRQSTVDGWAAHRTRAAFHLRDRPPVRHQIRQFDIADDQGIAIGRQRLTALLIALRHLVFRYVCRCLTPIHPIPISPHWLYG